MATPLLFSNTKSTFFDTNGEVLALGTVEVTYTLTSVVAVTYRDSIQSAQNLDPIPLDAAGKADIYLLPGHYNIVSKDADGVVVDTTTEYIVENSTPAPASDAGNVPIGGVVMYSGLFSNIPSDWLICDGTNGTPDLVDKFIKCTDVYDDIGDTGGSADAILVSHEHTTPSHTHTANHNHTGSFSGTNQTGSVFVHGGAGSLHATIFSSANGVFSTSPQNDGYGRITQVSESTTSLTTIRFSMTPSGSTTINTKTMDTGSSNGGDTGTSGSSGVGLNEPEYYTLAFIIRVT